MRNTMPILRLVKVALLTAAMICGCSLFESGNSKTDKPNLSGGGIRTTNGEVLGRVKFADASPAKGRQIRLYKIFLSAAPDSFQAEWAGISDSLGNYQFTKVPAGKFVMTVTDAKAGEMAIMPRLSNGAEGLFVLDALLAPWVTLVGRVLPPEGHKAEEITICIPGLAECAKVGPDSIYVIAHAPQGDYDLVFLQDTVANYLPIHVEKNLSDTLFVKDVRIDLGQLEPSSANNKFSYYPADTKHSLYVVPVPYLHNTVPDWYNGKKFEGIRYFIAVENKQFEQHDIEDYLDWGHSKMIRMPYYSPTDSSTKPLLDFPYLLRLNSTNFDFSQANGQGKDFRIGRGNGRHLPYFIERWDSLAGVAEIWTRIDTLLARNASQTLNFYWGNPKVIDHSIKSALLSRNPNERAVWLMDDNSPSSLVADLGGAFPGYFAKIGIGKGVTANNSVTGVIANALALNGRNDVITIDPHPILDFAQFTVSIWAKNDQAKLSTKQFIILKGDDQGRQWHLALDATNHIRFGVGGKMGKWLGSKITVDPVPNPDKWHQFVATFKAGVVRLYIDGVESATTQIGTIPNAIPDLSAGITLGVPLVSDGTYWKGQIDNFFYDSQDRSPEWIKLIYENEKL
jgi:Concanavalin A-like lectin/glucanases superfamily/Domain of unknown function (DUF2341)